MTQLAAALGGGVCTLGAPKEPWGVWGHRCGGGGAVHVPTLGTARPRLRFWQAAASHLVLSENGTGSHPGDVRSPRSVVRMPSGDTRSRRGGRGGHVPSSGGDVND